LPHFQEILMSQRMIEMILFFGALLLAVLATHAYLISRSEEQRLQSILLSQNAIISDASTRQQQRDTALASTLAEIAKQKSAKQSPEELADALAKVLVLPQPIHLVPAVVGNPLKSSSDSTGRKNGHSAQQASVTALPRPGELGVTSVLSSSTVPSSNSATELAHPGFTPPSDLPSTASVNATQLSAPSQVLPATPTSPEAPCSKSSKCPPGPQDAELPAADLKPLYNYALDCRACQTQLAVARQNASDDAAKIAALTRERDAAVTAAKGGRWLRRLRQNAIWFAAGAATAYVTSYR
jgi:hypothetical protein